MSSMTDTIRKRISCRTYDDKPVDIDLKRQLLDFVQANHTGPFGGKLRFQMLDLNEMEKKELKGLGTYGVIRGARLYMAGAVTAGSKAMEDFGYGMEKNILKATDLGLGTCWLGGTFNRSGFAERMALKEDEVVPAVSPIGYPRDKRSFTDRLFRLAASSNKRKPWQEIFYQGNFQKPLDVKDAGFYAEVLECVRLAPSASNKQPWRIVKEEGQNIFHLYLKRTPGYDRIFQGIKLQNIDMGIAACHFELTATEIGLSGRWSCRRPDVPRGELEYIATWEG